MKNWKAWFDEQQQKKVLRLDLADGYFRNFVEEVANVIASKTEDQTPKEGTVVKRLLIIVPLKLDWEKQDPIVDFVASMRNERYFEECKLLGTSNNKSSRCKWVNLVMSDSVPGERIIIDIPITISSIITRLRHASESGDTINEGTFQHEVKAFMTQIVKDLKEYKLDKYVTIVKMDELDGEFKGKMNAVNADLNNQKEYQTIRVIHVTRSGEDTEDSYITTVLDGKK